MEKSLTRNGSIKRGIGLRAYGQKNPLIEYKSESYNFFQELLINLRSTVIQRVSCPNK